MARGKKTCPGCSEELGARTKQCGCGFNFKALKNKNGATEVISPEVKEMMNMKHKPLPKQSPKEHAKRILGYGRERASQLLQQARSLKRWSHVDWNYVESQLS